MNYQRLVEHVHLMLPLSLVQRHVGVHWYRFKQGKCNYYRGPSSVWFGVGFGAQAMADLPWTIVIDGNGNVTERKLSNHAGGKLLAASIKVLSNTVKGDVRTVVLTRPLKGLNENYYTFDVSSTNGLIPIINAIGSTSAFGYLGSCK